MGAPGEGLRRPRWKMEAQTLDTDGGCGVRS